MIPYTILGTQLAKHKLKFFIVFKIPFLNLNLEISSANATTITVIGTNAIPIVVVKSPAKFTINNNLEKKNQSSQVR